MTTKPYHLSTWRTAAEVEAIDTAVEPLQWHIDPIQADGRFELGQPVLVTSKDECIFIGHIAEVDEDRLRIYIELD